LEWVGGALRGVGDVGCVLVSGPAGCGKSFAVERCCRHAPEVEVVKFDPLEGGFIEQVDQDKVMREILDDVVFGRVGTERLGRRAFVVDDAELWFGHSASVLLVLTVVDVLRELSRMGQSRPECVVVFISSNPEKLHPLLLDCVDEKIALDLQTPSERQVIWRALLGEDHCLVRNGFVSELNAHCNGWVASDIAAVAGSLANVDDQVKSLEIVNAHRPLMFQSDGGISAWTIVSAKDVSTTWDSIGGLEQVKRSLQEMIVWPTLHADMFCRLGIRAPGGVLLYGPPGTGKTLLASAVAKETGANFITVSIGDIMRGHVGESEKAISAVFSMARRIAPCVIFIDEFQAMFGNRDDVGSVGRKLVSQFLVETDVKVDGLILMASTNVPEAIDPSLLRAGRFDRKLYVPLPDQEGRLKILERKCLEMKSWGKDLTPEYLSLRTDGWSGAELNSLCTKAALIAIQNGQVDRIDKKCFDQVLETESKVLL